MAYSTDDIKALAAILKPIIKSALESGSTGVGDLEVVTSLDSVYSLPALRMPGGIHDVVEAPLSLLRVNLRVTTTHVQWKLGNGEWKDLLALSELKVVFRRTEKHLQWKVGAGSWEDIVELESLKGEKGDRGDAFRRGECKVIERASKEKASMGQEAGSMENAEMNYSRLLQAILDIAEEMLVAGAEVSRVEDSVERMCGAYGCDRINVFVITSNIQVTMEAPDGEILTQIRRIIRNDVNFDRLDYLNDLSRYICAETPSLAQLNEKFDGVMNRKIYSVWMKYVSAIFIAGGFAVFFGGQLLDGAASAVVGIAVIWLLNALSKRDHNLLATNFVVSFAAGLLSITLVHFGIGIHVDKIMIGAIMIQIPGIAMTNAVRDMLTGDLATGLLRLVNSLLLAAVIACGFALSILLTGGGIL